MNDGFRLHACCAERIAPDEQIFAEPISVPVEFTNYGPPTPDAFVSFIRHRGVAIHEAGHGAAGIALGGRCLGAAIDGQPHATAGPGMRSDLATIRALAGPAAQSWAESRIERMPDDLLGHWIAATRQLAGGNCDKCRAVRSCLLEMTRDGKGGWKPPVADEIVVSEYRRLENMAGTIVRLPMVWAAINEIADMLMEHGALTGGAVHAICSRHFDAGFVLETME